MSVTSEYEISPNGHCVSSAYDMGFGDSDIESSSSKRDQDLAVPKDYWFGRKYFESVMAQSLLHHTPLYEDMAEIDSKLEGVIKLFPYRQSLKKLEVQGLGGFIQDVIDDWNKEYRTMLTCIGAIVRTGTREQRKTLLITLREQSPFGVSSGLEDHDSALPKCSRDDWNGSQLHRPASEISLSTSALGQYSMVLKEYGDQHDIVPVYVVQCLSSYPPKFRAIVSFKDFTFESIARNKKQARHQAAREACKFLKIQV